jgi:hypothetical protein
VIHASLVDPQKVLLPPLHIKLSIMKQFVKALDKSGSCFQCLGRKFAALSEAKVKEGIFMDHKFGNSRRTPHLPIPRVTQNFRHGIHSRTSLRSSSEM